jgi:hypothetical protein
LSWRWGFAPATEAEVRGRIKPVTEQYKNSQAVKQQDHLLPEKFARPILILLFDLQQIAQNSV